jgi:hypothetical protein
MYQLSEKKENGSRPVIQTSLKIGQPGDKYEQEADAVADKVMMMSESETMQMQPVEEEEEVMQPKLRMQPLEEDVYAKRNKDLPKEVQVKLENSFGQDFSNVSIQKNSNRATELNARAFTQGEQIHFAPGEFNTNTNVGRNLLGHEITHVVQQRSGVVKPTSMISKGIEINENKSLEQEADILGRKTFNGETSSNYRSLGLDLRNSFRSAIQAKSNVIQRDIKGSKELGNGKMELDFTKNDATVKGGLANETGTVKFTPNKAAPKSDNIRLVQIVRVVDTTGISTNKGDPWNYAGSTEGDRDKVRTDANSSKNIAGGFFIDHSAAKANPRTNKSDAEVSPYYRDYWPNAGNSQDGHKKSTADIQHASLWDGPGHTAPAKYNFVTSAKGADTGTWYGTALWGFEIYSDKGIAKIKDEYKSFRENRGKTTDAALEKFNEFYQNPGTSKAPTK